VVTTPYRVKASIHFDGKTLKTFAETTDAQLETKITAAQACYEMRTTRSPTLRKAER